MTAVREPAVAGTFYPGDPSELATAVDALLAGASALRFPGPPIALVCPHAGYVYSGPVAASAYALLAEGVVRRVAILGPAHFVPLRGCAAPAAEAWRTPLGEVRVDGELRDAVAGRGVAVDDEPHEQEHSIEVQLPFLQRALPDGFTVLPVVVGSSEAGEVADVIDLVLAHALVVVSSDLSHYHDRETARRLDRRTADAILARDPGAIGAEDACGAFALRGIVEHARRRELEIELLDLRTSADIAGDPRRVVGYGAFAFRSG